MHDISPKRTPRGGAQGSENSRSIAEEIEDELRKNRHPFRKAAVVLAAVLLLGGGAYAFVGNHHGSTLAATTSAAPIASAPAPTPSATSAPTPAVPSPAVVPVPQAAADRAVAVAGNNKIQLCQMMLNAAIATSKNYNQMFFDGWNSWNTTYAGQLDSQAALDSKQSSKDYIKKLYTDYFNKNEASYLSACAPFTTPLAAVMDQPNYDAW
jgi:hypothetical protein